jgi:hypothetical protein
MSRSFLNSRTLIVIFYVFPSDLLFKIFALLFLFFIFSNIYIPFLCLYNWFFQSLHLVHLHYVSYLCIWFLSSLHFGLNLCIPFSIYVSGFFPLCIWFCIPFLSPHLVSFLSAFGSNICIPFPSSVSGFFPLCICFKSLHFFSYLCVLLPENLHTYFELSAQAWTLYKAP